MESGPDETPERPVVLRVEGLSKTFGSQRALSEVDLELREGEIHALVGQNGSGKSTLIKILSGFHEPDPGGRAWLGDSEITLGRLSAEEQGAMHFIHQDRALVESLSVRDNLGLEELGQRVLSRVHRREERDRTRELLKTFEVSIDPDANVSTLTPYEQSAVAIVRALGALNAASARDPAVNRPRVLVLDEPTAALGAAEAERLFRTLRVIRDDGVAILYVSHYLGEVMSLADRITVLRDGRRVAFRTTAGLSESELVELIVGQAVAHPAPPGASERDLEAPLQMRSVSGAAFTDVSLHVRHGEILGLTGLVGSGYEEVAACIGGTVPWSEGTIIVDGSELRTLSPRRALELGIAMVPGDRLRAGLIGSFTLAENITLPRTGSSWRRGWIHRGDERAEVSRWLATTGVVPADARMKVQDLSGGNQQKVLLAKMLRLQPRVLVLIEPTHAVDVGGSAAIRRLIVDSAGNEGLAVIIASTDAEELEQICHRVLVTRSGRIAVELTGSAITEDRLLQETQSVKGAT